MITSFQFQNWKSYEVAVLHIDPLTFLCGMDTCGKNAALEALAFLRLLAGGATLTDAQQSVSTAPVTRLSNDRGPTQSRARFSLGLTCRVEPSIDLQYMLECQNIDDQCEVISERLLRVVYQIDEAGQRSAPMDSSKLFSSQAGLSTSPQIVAQVEADNQGELLVLQRARSLLFQLYRQSLPHDAQQGVAHLIEALRNITECALPPDPGMPELNAILSALQQRPAGSLFVVHGSGYGMAPQCAADLLDRLRKRGAEQTVDVLICTGYGPLLDVVGTEMVPFITIAHRSPTDHHSLLTLLEDVDMLPKLLAQGGIAKLLRAGLIEGAMATMAHMNYARSQLPPDSPLEDAPLPTAPRQANPHG